MVKVLIYITYLLNVSNFVKVLILRDDIRIVYNILFKIIIKTLLCVNCVSYKNIFLKYCNNCLSCYLFFVNKHPDIYFLDCAKIDSVDLINHVYSLCEINNIISKIKICILKNFDFIDINVLKLLFDLSKTQNDVFFIVFFSGDKIKHLYCDSYIQFYNLKYFITNIYEKCLIRHKKIYIENSLLINNLYILVYKCLLKKKFICEHKTLFFINSLNACKIYSLSNENLIVLLFYVKFLLNYLDSSL